MWSLYEDYWGEVKLEINIISTRNNTLLCVCSFALISTHTQYLHHISTHVVISTSHFNCVSCECHLKETPKHTNAHTHKLAHSFFFPNDLSYSFFSLDGVRASFNRPLSLANVAPLHLCKQRYHDKTLL